MTAGRRDGNHETGFAKWVRSVPSLDSREGGVANMDVDWIWHQYKEPSDSVHQNRRINHVMFIEEKSHGRDLTIAQRDTMWQLHQALARLKPQHVTNVRRQTILLKFWGYHKLQYSGASPDQSELIMWDRRPVTIETLIGILRFDIRPDTLTRFDSRVSHHRLSQYFLFPD